MRVDEWMNPLRSLLQHSTATSCFNSAACDESSLVPDSPIAGRMQRRRTEEERPPAPPVRLTSRSAASSVPPSPQMQPRSLHHLSPNLSHSHHLQALNLQQLKNVINHMSASVEKPLPKEPDEERKKFFLKSKTSSFRYKDKKGKPGPDYPSADCKPVISTPTNFEHTVHVGFDSTTGEFTGIPASWSQLLSSSNISKSEQEKNPQAVIDVLKFFDSTSQGKEPHAPKFMTLDQGLGKSSLRPNPCRSLIYLSVSDQQKHPQVPVR